MFEKRRAATQFEAEQEVRKCPFSTPSAQARPEAHRTPWPPYRFPTRPIERLCRFLTWPVGRPCRCLGTSVSRRVVLGLERF